MPISADWTINYAQRRIYHSFGTEVYSLNELYSYLMNVFDESATIDDTIPMTAQTPTAYTLTNGWFLDYVNNSSHQYLDGGSLKTIGWDANLSNVGIRLLTFESGGYVSAEAGDIGGTVTGDPSGDTATLLAYDNILRKWWVRVVNTGDAFASAESVTVNAHGGTTTGASVTGENTWTNIFTLGTLSANTQIYLYQNGTRLTPWWNTGHINVLVLVKESGSLIASGIVIVLARQYTKLYDHYLADLGSGNQTPIPLATFADTNNRTGYRRFTGSSGSGTFIIGNLIQKSGDAAIQGILTAVSGATLTPTLTYYLFKSAFDDFQNGDSVVQIPSGPTCTAGTSNPVGPANLTNPITISFGSYTHDLNNNNGSQPYDVEIDCNNNPLEDVYEYLKYITRYGYTTAINGTPGEAYVAAQTAYDPVKQSPFGTFAGGTFFGARGIWLLNYLAADANNFELIDANNVPQIPPLTNSIIITGLEAGDRVSVFPTTGNNEIIYRNQFSSHISNNVSGWGFFEVQETIDPDVPSSGILRVIDNILNREQRYPYSSWTNSPNHVFTLDSVTLDRNYESSDTAYVPYIDTTATNDTVSQTIIYYTDRNVLTVVRMAGIQPFKVKGVIRTTGLTVAAIRTTDSVYQ